MTDTNTKRPLVTFALFAYNQEKYIREAIEGAFSQTYEPLEIILSDDCSSDRTFEIMQEVVAAYDGPHRLLLRRNKRNLGLAAHVNTVLELCCGEIVVVAAGDDVSLPDRTGTSVDILCRNPGAMAVLMSADIVDDQGNIVGEKTVCKSKAEKHSQNIGDLLAWRHLTFGATRAFRREVFTIFGPLRENCPTEDTPLLLRSLICGSNIFSPTKGVNYRRHDRNLSSAISLANMNVDEIYRQYRDDIDKAEQSGLLTAEIAKLLRIWTQSDRKAREVRLRILNDGRLSIKDYFFMFQHPSFTIKDSLKVIVNSLFSFRVGSA